MGAKPFGAVKESSVRSRASALIAEWHSHFFSPPVMLGELSGHTSIEAVGCLQVLMVEPVIAADGHTYEKAAIQTWLQQHTISPVTGAFLAHTRIVPNVLIKSAVGTNQGL